MKYITYLLALGIFLYSGSLAAGDMGLGKLWDAICFIIVIVAPYLLLVSATGTFTFYKDKGHLKLWGDWAFRFGWLGAMLGLIFMLAGMAVPPPPGVDVVGAIGAGLAVAFICPFYGMFFKYFIIAHWLECCKK